MSTNLGSSQQRELETAMRIGCWTGGVMVVALEAFAIGLFLIFMHLGMMPWPCR